MHDVVRRHATTLRAAICITVLGIAVLLIRCARCLVWIPFVGPAVVTRCHLQPLGYFIAERSGSHGCGEPMGVDGNNARAGV